MAEKKKAETKAEETEVKETEAETSAENMEEIELFKDGKDYKDDVFVCINGKNMLIKRGEKIKIPTAYAKVIKQSLRQDTATAMLMASKQDEFTSEVRARNI